MIDRPINESSNQSISAKTFFSSVRLPLYFATMNTLLAYFSSYFPLLIFSHKSCQLYHSKTISDFIIKLHAFVKLHQANYHAQEP